jgi:hypothetical protein
MVRSVAEFLVPVTVVEFVRVIRVRELAKAVASVEVPRCINTAFATLTAVMVAVAEVTSESVTVPY